MDNQNFEQAKQYIHQRLERELSPKLFYQGITHVRDDVVPTVEIHPSFEGVQVIHFTHDGH